MLLDIIKAKLVNAGVANTTTCKCYIGFLPDIADLSISLHLTGGFGQDTHEGETVTETFQLRVRTGPMEYIACESKWRAAFKALHDADLSANGIRLIQALATGPLEFFDDKNRPNMTANFRVIRDTP